MATRDLIIRIHTDIGGSEHVIRLIEERIKVLNKEFDTGKVKLDAYQKEFRELNTILAESKTDLQGFQSELKKHETQTTKTSTAMDGLVGVVKRFIAPAAVGLAVKQTIAWADSISDLHDKTGISISSLQKFERAAAMTGGSMDTVANSALELTRRLGEGDKGTIAAVAKLGLNFAQLRSQDMGKTFLDVTAALVKMQDPTQQAVIGNDLLGRGWKDMIPVAKAMSSELGNMAVASDANVRALGRMADSWAVLKIQGKAFIADVLGPMIRANDAISAQVQIAGGGFLRGDAFKRAQQRMQGALPAVPSITPFGTQGSLAAVGMPTGTDINRLMALTAGGGAARSSTVRQAIAAAIGLPSVPGVVGGLPGLGGGTFPVDIPPPALTSTVLPGGGMTTLPGAVTGVSPGRMGPGAIGSFGSSFTAGLPGVILGALQGGGNMLGSIGGLAGGAASSLIKTGSGFLNSFLPGAGTLLGGLLGKIGGAFGPSAKAKEDAGLAPQIEGLRQQLLGTYGTMENIRQLGNIIGVDLANAFGHVGKEGLAQFQKQIESFMKAQDKLQAALEKYGLTWEDLGTSAKKFFFEAEAAALLKDFDLLKAAGVDETKLLEKMASSWNLLIQTAQRNGMEIPNAMKPAIDRLIEMGLLIDEAGDKIANLDNIFAQLKPAPIQVDVELNYPTPEPVTEAFMSGGKVGMAYMARGGIMRGTDRMLAALTPGEFVMSREAVKRIGSGKLQAMNKGGEASGASVHIHVDARESLFDGITVERWADKIGQSILRKVRVNRLVVSGAGA